MKAILSILICGCFSLVAQNQEECCNLDWSTALPNISANHPIGIFLSRSQVNFGAQQKGKTFRFEYNIGNVWLPKVNAYFPTNEVDRAYAESYVWHYRGHQFWQNPDSMSFEADGVLRTYKLSYDISLNQAQQLSINASIYSLDGGNFPFSTISSDGFIEWFHSNVAGGEDPFARKDYTFNQALIRYRDREGEELVLKNGAIGLATVSLNYQYQISSSWLGRHDIQLLVNAMLGVNAHAFNRSVNVGTGFLGMKDIRLGKSSLFRLGVSGETTNINSFDFDTKGAITDASWISQFSFFMGWEKALKKQRALSISTLHQIQSSYFKPDGANYYALLGDSDVSHWHYAISHLYRKTFGNSLIVAYRRKGLTYHVYLRQDLIEADNAPDIQTGIGFNYNL